MVEDQELRVALKEHIEREFGTGREFLALYQSLEARLAYRVAFMAGYKAGKEKRDVG